MADDENDKPSVPTEPPPVSETVTTTLKEKLSTITSSTWKVFEGMEEHVESGLTKTATGALVGGLLGLALFKSGGGWRTASAAAGLGVGVGSTLQRANLGK